MHIGAYRAQQQGYGHHLQLFMSKKDEERGKTTWGKSYLNKGQGTTFETCLQLCIYLHFNELNELLLVKYFDEEIMNSMIMRYSVESTRRKWRDSWDLIN